MNDFSDRTTPVIVSGVALITLAPKRA